MSAQLDWILLKRTRALRVAKAAGELGMQRAEDAAEREFSEFREQARAFVLAYLAKHGRSPSEDITDAMIEAGMRVKDERAFGAVYAYLSKTGRIKCVGSCLRVKGNSTSGGRIWALA